MPEVFLSHASQDEPQARRLRALLIRHGVRVWFSPHHLRGAQEWQQEIGAALDRCDWFVVLLSRHAVNSMWVGREVSYALAQKRYRKRIVPVLLARCNARALSWVLPQLQIIDFTGDYARACEQLLRIWSIRTRTRGKR